MPFELQSSIGVCLSSFLRPLRFKVCDAWTMNRAATRTRGAKYPFAAALLVH